MLPRPMEGELPLLEVMQKRMNCTYLSDLRFLKREQKNQLALEWKKVPAEAASLSVWNDALTYLTDAPPQPTREAAKGLLIRRLSPRITFEECWKRNRCR